MERMESPLEVHVRDDMMTGSRLFAVRANMDMLATRMAPDLYDRCLREVSNRLADDVMARVKDNVLAGVKEGELRVLVLSLVEKEISKLYSKEVQDLVDARKEAGKDAKV